MAKAPEVAMPMFPVAKAEKKDDHGSQWHLHNDPYDVDHRLRTAGFVWTETLGGITRCYRAVDPTTQRFRAAMMLNSVSIPFRRFGDSARMIARAFRKRLRG